MPLGLGLWYIGSLRLSRQTSLSPQLVELRPREKTGKPMLIVWVHPCLSPLLPFPDERSVGSEKQPLNCVAVAPGLCSVPVEKLCFLLWMIRLRSWHHVCLLNSSHLIIAQLTPMEPVLLINTIKYSTHYNFLWEPSCFIRTLLNTLLILAFFENLLVAPPWASLFSNTLLSYDPSRHQSLVYFTFLVCGPENCWVASSES